MWRSVKFGPEILARKNHAGRIIQNNFEHSPLKRACTIDGLPKASSVSLLHKTFSSTGEKVEISHTKKQEPNFFKCIQTRNGYCPIRIHEVEEAKATKNIKVERVNAKQSSMGGFFVGPIFFIVFLLGYNKSLAAEEDDNDDDDDDEPAKATKKR